MTTFLESPRFPDNIAFGATVGPTYLTVVNTVYSGRDGRIPAWTQSRIRLDVGRRMMNAADTATLDAFFRVVKGRAYGFRIKDWTDYQVTTGNGVLTPTQGANGSIYQLGKFYQQGALSEMRAISKPVVGSTGLYLNASALSTLAYSLDTTTGLVTLQPQSPFPHGAVSSIAVGATTNVTATATIAGVSVGDYVTVQGAAGADNGLVNNVPAQVTAIAGAVYTLNVNTTGKSISGISSATTLARYAQGTDVLAWSGQFDVPVRFDADEMKKQVMDRNGTAGDLLVNWDSIPIVEIRV